LGIGIFNALSAPAEATIRDTITGRNRSFQTNPLTNYNILVFDKNLKNNSYVTLINTNVLRNGNDYEANVTGTSFSFRNKPQTYALDGKLAVSQKYFPGSTDLGHTFFTKIQRTSGKLQWNLGYSQESLHFDPNDLGFLFSPNEKTWFGSVEFNQNEPFGKFTEARIQFDMEYVRLYKPDAFSNYGLGFNGFMLTKKRFAFGVFGWVEPVEFFDYFEPRTDDFSRYYRRPGNYNLGGFISTDYRKKLALDIESNFRRFNEEGRYRFNVQVSPRFRVNDRLSFVISAGSYNFKNDVGYVTSLPGGDIIFGIRDYITVENFFNATYIFNNRMSFSFRLRHYWSKAAYHHFRLLDENGGLVPTDFDYFSDNSYDFFSIDAVYRWRFAPGSDIFIVWKNNTEQYANDQQAVLYDYSDSVRKLTSLPQINSLSFKLIYYLDYLSLKKK
jgi:hypothetical protein